VIEAIQQQLDGRIEFAQGEKLVVAQHRQDPPSRRTVTGG
jgi:hypothetical protein